jgi:hypothetical protein
MSSNKGLAETRPLAIGRLTRVLFGIGTFVAIFVIGPSTLGTIGTVLVAALGVSFVVGGLIGNPGCEITAVPNLVLPKSKRIHCL